MAYTKYSLTPANNTAAPPDGAPEGMLPSAVNDTMRDMMAQIRDVGDGVRDGTYTMTAPKITGGTITGVTLTGNTLSSPVISGGTINNATIGATTATTGKFTSVTNTGLTSGRVMYATTGGLVTDSSNLVFDGSNLGIGVTPSAWRTTDRAFEIGSVGKGLSAPTSSNSVFLATNWYVNTTPANVYAANGYASRYAQSDGTHIWSTAPSNSSGAGAALTFTQAMTLDAGNLLVGTTSNAGGDRLNVVGGGVKVNASGTAFNILSLQDSVDQSGATFIQFLNSTGGSIGNINRVTTTNAVVYNTTSDYRLKTVTGSVTGQGERIDALKPIDYQWKEGNQQSRGFLAHEFQTVYPNSVSGEKDAIDSNGKPVYQGMQASTAEVIADLVAEIQSLRQRIATLENK